jgi:3-hydroxyisobutyrate dehydrogenase
MCGVQAAALAEAMALIEKSDLDRATALTVLINGAPGSPLVKAVASRMAARDYTVNFALALMTKDLVYAQREAARQQMVLTIGAAADRVFHQAIDAGHGRKDFAAVVEPLRSGA